MDRAENAALALAGLLMAVFLAALVYSAAGLNITVPTCVTDMEPFREGKVIDKGDGRYEVHVVAKMWDFEPKEIRLPPGAEVDFYLSALDVTHGMYIERTNLNLMAVPGSVNAASVRFDEEGEYDVICHEYCGLGHHKMMGKIVVAEGATPIVPGEQPAADAELTPLQHGEKLYGEYCAACHSVDGSDGVGPTMKGIFGREVKLEGGASVDAGEAYLVKAIKEPEAEIVEGYAPVMPALPLSDEEVRDIVHYLKTLS